MVTPTTTQCTVCGRALLNSRLRGLCAACLVKGITSSGERVSADESTALFRIPGHEVLEEISRGGMGIVYRARQHDPAREVALKMLLPGGSSASLRERFRNEARTMVELDHPGVLPLYQFGEHGGTPWFTMKLAAGGTLAERLRDGSFRPRAAAELIAGIADAVAYAHQRGVLHRDLKPGNILFDADGKTYVADFGLAKLASAVSGLTHSQSMLGTPHYMAPELAQKAGVQATVATDVYALGAILYETLAGRPPFQAETLVGLLRSIIEDDPPSLLTLRGDSHAGRIPRELAAIAGKALAREPARRYRDAAALAADLRAWLAGEAIEAKPPGPREKFLRWVRKHPAIAASVAVLAAGAASVILLQAKAGRELRAEKSVALVAQADALAAQVATARAGGRPDTRDAALAAAREAAKRNVTGALRDDAITLLATPGWRLLESRPVGACGIVPLSPAHDVLADLKDGRLVLYDLVGNDPPHSVPSAPVPLSWVEQITDKGRLILVRDNKGAHHLYDRQQDRWVRTWSEPILDTAVSSDGKWLARGLDTTSAVLIENLVTGEIRQRLTSQHAQPVPIAFSPDGLRLAVAGSKAAGVELFELSAGTLKETLSTIMLDQSWARAAWRPDSRGIVLAMGATDLFSFSFGGHETLRERVIGHRADVFSVTYHPDGRWFATCGFDTTVRLWESASRREIMRLPLLASAVHFSSDGRELACMDSGGGMLHRFAFTAPDCVVQLALPRTSSDEYRQRPPWGCAVTPDGRIGVTTSDYGIHYFDPLTGLRLGGQNPGYCCDIVTTGGGDAIFVGGAKGIFRVPLLRTSALGHEAVVLGGIDNLAVSGDLYRMSWSESRRRLAFVTGGGAGFIDHPGEISAGTAQMLPAPPFALNPVAISPDGRWIAASGGDSSSDGLVIWDADHPAPPLVLPGYARYTSPRFSPDGRILYTYSATGLTAHHTGTWEIAWSVPRQEAAKTNRQMALSGDGVLIGIAEAFGGIGLYLAATGKHLATINHPDGRYLGWFTFDYSGARLIVTTLPDSVLSWDLRKLRSQLAELGLDWGAPPYPPAPEHREMHLRYLPSVPSK